MPKLLLKFNAAVLKEIAISKDSVSVGRKAENDIVIDNPAISAHHCRITLEGGTYFVEDLESTNGTFVNQKRVKKSGLHHNDVVGLAKHALVFVEDAPPKAVPAAAAPPPDATIALLPQQQAEIAASAVKDGAAGKLGILRVLKGIVGAAEYELKGTSTYIGMSDRVQVQIKSSGFFGSSPDVAALIARKPEGYWLQALEPGFPVVNGDKVQASVLLKDGDLIECGGTTMQFVTKDAA
jgi:pSer/pThr/pTyr-binding forkhead associated (FHA) protein